jgi:hypothetical protein
VGGGRREAHESGGNGLVGSKREARRGRTDRIAGRRGHLSLEDLVAQRRASHGGIGAREGAERRAGSEVAVQHGGDTAFRGRRVSKIGEEKPRVRPDCRINPPNWTLKKLAMVFESGDEGIHPENDLVSKSRAWGFPGGSK